jgi:hypothetical protein
MTITKFKLVVAAFVATILTGTAAAPARQCHEQTQPDTKGQKASPDEGLDLAKVLQAFDQSRNQIQSLHGSYKITHVDSVLRRERVDQAEVWYLKPDLFRIDIHSTPARLTILVGTKEELSYSDSDKKRQWVCDRAATMKCRPESGFWARLSWLMKGGMELEMEDWCRLAIRGMTTEETTNRFNVSVAHQDQHYVYLRLAPRLAPDRQEFQLLYLALDKKSYRVSAARFHEVNGDEIRVESTKTEINPQPPIKPAAMLQDLPKGWTSIKNPFRDSPE